MLVVQARELMMKYDGMMGRKTNLAMKRTEIVLS